jgi:hypothetical protein
MERAIEETTLSSDGFGVLNSDDGCYRCETKKCNVRRNYELEDAYSRQGGYVMQSKEKKTTDCVGAHFGYMCLSRISCAEIYLQNFNI